MRGRIRRTLAKVAALPLVVGAAVMLVGVMPAHAFSLVSSSQNGFVYQTATADCQYVANEVWTDNPPDNYVSATSTVWLDGGPNCSVGEYAPSGTLTMEQDLWLLSYSAPYATLCRQGARLVNNGYPAQWLQTTQTWTSAPCGSGYYEVATIAYFQTPGGAWDGGEMNSYPQGDMYNAIWIY